MISGWTWSSGRPRGRYSGTTTQQGTPSNPLGNVDGKNPFVRQK
jgi:hypothetical protein